MNKIINTVFDKYCVSTENDEWVITEANKGASFNKLRIKGPGREFYVFDSAFYSGLSSITTNRSTRLEDKDCDGVAFTVVDGCIYFMFAELKSSLASTDIYKAYKQLTYTYLKLCMLLSICKNFNFQDYKILGLIGCRPVKNEEQETRFKDDYLLYSDANPSDMSFMLKLYYEKKITVNISEIPFIKELPLNNNLDCSATIVMETADTYGDSEKSVNFDDLVRFAR